jgi:hypothetical protein
VISDNDIGELLAERKVSNIVEALQSRFKKIYNKEVFARFSSQLSWRDITQQQCEILSQLVAINNNKGSH